MANYCCSFRATGGLTAGTYKMEADWINGQGYSAEPGSWTMHLYPYDPDAVNLNISEIANFTGTPDFIVDGWVPWTENSVSTYGDYVCCTIAYIDDDGNLVFPSLVKNVVLNAASGSYYMGVVSVAERDGNTIYYSPDYPPLTVEKQSAYVWKNDMGLFLAGFSSHEMSSTLEVWFQAVCGLTITKQSSVLPLSTGAVSPLKELSVEPAGEALKAGSGHMRSMTVFSKPRK